MAARTAAITTTSITTCDLYHDDDYGGYDYCDNDNHCDYNNDYDHEY